MKFTPWHVIGIIAVVFALFWVYEANPLNVFQRETAPAA